ncbi:nucleoside-diphosphate kinase [Xylanibacillus composti]|uniref:Nucleoside diphosphate kinase n=1 Tax=Xylanibacillus composti TaxID=1572762 RepID=A0A8J4H0Z6_9BACL|nr:nucleoside-diphosphate kinase [Xylanibacillus composti]MDT9725461.1 nucleoside-diphosphate kinase [Xylanibacillus composti]GIQ67555.1 nucleoside diphosphate kinase [Xylanibacillus composti]
MAQQQTFLMVKPDAVQRGLIGEIVQRFERKGFRLVAGKLVRMTEQQAEFHYAEHKGKEFFGDLVSFITSGPVFAMVWEGDEIIALSRTLIGKTNVKEAAPGTIRGDFALHTNRNLIHGSDSPESAAREISNFFGTEELVRYERQIEQWL